MARHFCIDGKVARAAIAKGEYQDFLLVSEGVSNRKVIYVFESNTYELIQGGALDRFLPPPTTGAASVSRRGCVGRGRTIKGGGTSLLCPPQPPPIVSLPTCPPPSIRNSIDFYRFVGLRGGGKWGGNTSNKVI